LSIELMSKRLNTVTKQTIGLCDSIIAMAFIIREKLRLNFIR
jgi:hypothetical protein